MRRAVQHRAVHVDGLERLPGRGERRRKGRMGVDDRADIGALAVDPDVKARSGIGPPALQRPEVLVDQDHALGAGFVKAVTELQRPPRARLLGARAHLSGQPGFMALAGENAAGRGQRFARGQCLRRQVLGHLAADAVDKMGLLIHVSPPARSSMMAEISFSPLPCAASRR
jgi:hypothetical protein